MTMHEWVDGVFNRAIDVDGAYGAQCVDLVNDYLERVHATGRVRGNAIDLVAQPIKGFAWVANGRMNYPSTGDIVVWNSAPFGHTAVCLWASPMHLVSLDQNWAGIQRAEVIVHGYEAVAGWHHLTQTL